MVDRRPPKYDNPTENDSPSPEEPTQSIKLADLFPSYLTASGSFSVEERQTTGLKKLLHGMPIPALLIDEDRSVSFANDACLKVSADPVNVMGKTFLSLFPRDYEANVARSMLDSVFVDRQPRTCEGLLWLDKRKIWGRIHLRSLRMGTLRSILVLIEDLTFEKKQLLANQRHQNELRRAHDELEKRVQERTAELTRINEQLRAEVEERTQAQKQLRQSEEKYRNLIEMMNEAFSIRDEEGRITFVNDKHSKMIGFSREETIGRPVSDFLDLRSYHILQEQTEKHKITKGGSYEAVYIGKDGRRIPAIISERPIFGPNDQYMGSTAVITDITKLKTTEAMLIRARDDLEKRIKERTADLAETNEKLLFEISQRNSMEEALRRSEFRFRQIYDRAPVMMHSIDKNGIIRNVNAKWLKELGYSREEAISKKIDFIMAPDSTETLSAVLPQFWHEGQINDVPYKYIKKDGSVIDVLLDSVVMDDPAWGIVSLSVVRDITDKKRAEEALRESEERYRAVVEAQTDLICRCLKDGSITFVNTSFSRFFGESREDLIGLGFLDLVPEQDRERIGDILSTISLATPSDTCEHRVIPPDGRLRWVQWDLQGVFNSEENLVEFQCVGRDVTDRKSAEDALRASEERTRLLIELSPVGIGIVRNSVYAYANPALVDLLGCQNPDEIVGRSLEEFFHPEDRDLTRIWPDSVSQTYRHASHCELRGLKKGGETFDAQLWHTRIDYMGEPALLLFLADTSEAKILRAQLLHAQKMEAVGTLAGGIAHDFNNLLTGILGYADLLLEDKKEGDPDHADLQKIIRSARHGADLVQRILTFSRTTETTPRPVDLNSVVHHMKDILARTFPKIIQIDLALAEDLLYINADYSQVEQVLINLALNAKDAMPNGGRLLIQTANVCLNEEYCRTHLLAREGDYVALTVADTGHGMAKEIQDHIFEPFFTTKEPGKGTGLGLPMVYGIVKQHGGFINFESESGRGTTFRIFIPALHRRTELFETSEESGPLDGNETILLVDDEEFIRDLGTRYLGKAGYRVLTAASGFQALEIYRKEDKEISLVITDLMMPDMTGKQCLDELVKINPDVRVLVASGYAKEESVSFELLGRVEDFVHKPYEKTQLLLAIRKILDKDEI
ncbi:MAG: PAS domain S-box protein [Desulfomonile tiedjei]|uniref:histidine kinase n=1 Tax=Desulfomonile tiedjei TaxID=2358 RepID=A0A9D6YYR1_9BACT|nr:PAS domain S-box protein [Desulfomonile tiedjei]